MSEPAVKFSFQNAAAFPQLPSRSVMIRWMTRACELPTMMTVRFVDQEEGYELNHSYRHRDYATNVLTFNYTTEPEVTADVAICVPVVEREAAEQNKEFRAHLAHLLIHAVLHAHGYDHVTQEEAEVMEAHALPQVPQSLQRPHRHGARLTLTKLKTSCSGKYVQFL